MDQRTTKSTVSRQTAHLTNGRQEFTERAAAFFVALEQAGPVDENDPFADLEPDIQEEELNELVVYED